MAKPNVCKQCGKEFTHTPVYSGIHSHGIFEDGGHTDGFCSGGCLKAYKSREKAEKAQARAEDRRIQEEKRRQKLVKEHENARTEAKEALEKAQKNVKKWEKVVEKLESAIESDDIEELKDATLELTSWSSVVITLLILLDVGAAVWYYFFR